MNLNIHGDNRINFGFIAEDLLELFPEDKYTIVSKDDDGDYIIDSEQLIAILCLCIQKLLKNK